MTDEEKVTNGRNFRRSHQLRSTDLTAAHVNLAEISESIIKTAEEKLQDVSGNLIPSPAIDPSIYQVDVSTEDETTTTTVAPAPGADPAAEVALEGAATEGAPSAESEPVPTEDAAQDQPAVETETQEPAPAPESEEKIESAETAAESEVKTESAEPQASEKPPEEATTPTSETDEKKADEKGEGAKEASVDGGTRRTTTSETTTETPSKDPYQIDIPIDRKINKRTKRKLWEEIEKRKPLIPKYVERHIQKYAKPPFELWGCKFRGKGSCYGCGG